MTTMKKFTNSRRLHDWDYATPAWYFVTICTKNMHHHFGTVESGHVILNQMGKIAQQNWLLIPEHHDNVDLDAFIIMPNHVHGILFLTDENENLENNVATLHATSLRADLEELNSSYFSKISPKKFSLSTIIRSYKSSTTRMIHQLPKASFAWQPRFYDHIIRTESDLEKLRQYISLNPENWQDKQLEFVPSEVALHVP